VRSGSGVGGGQVRADQHRLANSALALLLLHVPGSWTGRASATGRVESGIPAAAIKEFRNLLLVELADRDFAVLGRETVFFSCPLIPSTR